MSTTYQEGKLCRFGRQHSWSTALAAALNSNEGMDLPADPEWVYWCWYCKTVAPWIVEPPCNHDAAAINAQGVCECGERVTDNYVGPFGEPIPPSTEEQCIDDFRRYDPDGCEMFLRQTRVHQEPFAEIVLETDEEPFSIRIGHKLDRDAARGLAFALLSWAKDAT